MHTGTSKNAAHALCLLFLLDRLHFLPYCGSCMRLAADALNSKMQLHLLPLLQLMHVVGRLCLLVSAGRWEVQLLLLIARRRLVVPARALSYHAEERP